MTYDHSVILGNDLVICLQVKYVLMSVRKVTDPKGKKRVKQSLYMGGQPLRVPGG